jgi:hypothetical protein
LRHIKPDNRKTNRCSRSEAIEQIESVLNGNSIVTFEGKSLTKSQYIEHIESISQSVADGQKPILRNKLEVVISKEVIVVWSLEAKKSLSEIYNYIFEDSPQNAEKVLNKIIDLAESLQDERYDAIDPIINRNSAI